jgi:hypothetical protein
LEFWHETIPDDTQRSIIPIISRMLRTSKHIILPSDLGRGCRGTSAATVTPATGDTLFVYIWLAVACVWILRKEYFALWQWPEKYLGNWYLERRELGVRLGGFGEGQGVVGQQHRTGIC